MSILLILSKIWNLCQSCRQHDPVWDSLALSAVSGLSVMHVHNSSWYPRVSAVAAVAALLLLGSIAAGVLPACRPCLIGNFVLFVVTSRRATLVTVSSNRRLFPAVVAAVAAPTFAYLVSGNEQDRHFLLPEGTIIAERDLVGLRSVGPGPYLLLVLELSDCPPCEKLRTTLERVHRAVGDEVTVVRLHAHSPAPASELIHRVNPNGVYPALYLIDPDGVILCSTTGTSPGTPDDFNRFLQQIGSLECDWNFLSMSNSGNRLNVVMGRDFAKAAPIRPVFDLAAKVDDTLAIDFSQPRVVRFFAGSRPFALLHGLPDDCIAMLRRMSEIAGRPTVIVTRRGLLTLTDLSLIKKNIGDNSNETMLNQ